MIRLLHTLIILVCCISSYAQTSPSAIGQQKEDSVEFYLLTCYPGKEVYNIYGHTAIRYKNFSSSQDLTFNYGIFNFRQKNFALNFALGETYYELGVIPYDLFMDNYIAQGRKVIAQRLNLTLDQKKALFRALYENAKPENKTYLYNFLFDNCCTRARDIIYSAINSDSCHVAKSLSPALPSREGAKAKAKANAKAKAKALSLEGRAGREAPTLTWREDLHTYTTHDTWAELGNDLALGAGADKKMEGDENEFLPLNLLKNFFNTKIVYSKEETNSLSPALPSREGAKAKAKANANALSLEGRAGREAAPETPLVLDAEVLYEGSEVAKYEEPYPSPSVCSILLAAILLIITLIELKQKHLFVIVDRILYLLLGIGGCLLLVLAISRHPLTGYNLNMLVFNPLLIVAALFIGKTKIRKAMTVYFLVVFILNLILSPQVQDIPEFTRNLGVILFLRSMINPSPK